MADFGEYPPNLPVKDALVVRQAATIDHVVAPYTGDDLRRPKQGPANPFKDDTVVENTALKRKNVLTGLAEETFISEHTFRSKHRAVERGDGPEREYVSGAQAKERAAKLRANREGKGNATIADGDNAYVGPWAKYKAPEYEEVEVDLDELGSDEEYEIVDEDDEVVPSGTLVSAPTASLARRKEAEELGDETTTFHGQEQYDYQGRTYMHIPQDLDFSLQKEVGSVTNFIPKKLIHTWRHHNKPVTSLRLFPQSSHLGLSGSADGTVKIWDIYRSKELLRTYSGHSKAITDLSFNKDGTQFLSGSFDRWVKLWDTETGQCVNRFNSAKTPHVIRFNPSADHGHEFLAGLSDNRILQYDTRAGSDPIQEYDHHLGAINTLEFVDENRRFMSTSDDRSLRVWEYGIPVEIKTIRCVPFDHKPPLMLQILIRRKVSPTCSPSPNLPSTPAGNTSSTSAATTPSLPTRPHQTSSDRTARSRGVVTTRLAVPSVLPAVRMANSSSRVTRADTSASGTSRRARCTTRSRPTVRGDRSTAWRGLSRRPARCLPRAPRARLRCGISRGCMYVCIYEFCGF